MNHPFWGRWGKLTIPTGSEGETPGNSNKILPGWKTCEIIVESCCTSKCSWTFPSVDRFDKSFFMIFFSDSPYVVNPGCWFGCHWTSIFVQSLGDFHLIPSDELIFFQLNQQHLLASQVQPGASWLRLHPGVPRCGGMRADSYRVVGIWLAFHIVIGILTK